MSTELPQGVKATSGGAFDRDDSFLFFLASSPSAVERTTGQVGARQVLVAVNELESPKSLEVLDRLCDSGVRVMLDSGIFNLAMEHVRAHGTSHDEALSMAPDQIDGFDALWERYGQIVTKYKDRLWGVVELDQGGAEHKPVTRARIENEFGIVPIPVYHPLLDGWDYYDSLAKNYDRICFGNIVQAHPSLRLRLAYTAYERSRAYPYLWTHLLGLYPNPATLALPMRGSSDASSWLTAVRWYPSWRAWSMLHMITNYPPSMWSDKETQGEAYDRGRAERICGITASAAQMVLDDVKKGAA